MSRFLFCDAEYTSWNEFIEVVNGAWTKASKVRAKGSWTGRIVHLVFYKNTSPISWSKRITRDDRSFSFENTGFGASIDESVTFFQVDRPSGSEGSREADQSQDG